MTEDAANDLNSRQQIVRCFAISRCTSTDTKPGRRPRAVHDDKETYRYSQMELDSSHNSNTL